MGAATRRIALLLPVACAAGPAWPYDDAVPAAPTEATAATPAGGLARPQPAPAAAVQPALAPAAPTARPLNRPRIGLVLSGGGARGLAHVGVLKVLERARVPVDVIAGTSMGAIIGGLYASGMSAEQLERELRAVEWTTLFAARVERQQLSERRKEEDFDFSPVLEIGLRRGQLTLPIGSVSSRGLEILLRRYTLPVRGATSFDALPIPFRAVATDMENGRPVVFDRGDLATALRSSMSVPGVFAPTEVDGRILGDGGLVDNLPVDVARKLGADVIIAVNIGTPLAPRDSLATLLGVTSQMINILTEQNVQRSLASLDPARDLLVSPPLGELTSGDFARVTDFIARGEAHAESLREQFARWSLDEPQWAALQAERQRRPPEPPPVAQVRFEGQDISNPDRLAAELETQRDAPFDVRAAERDVELLAARGDYLRTDYHLEDLPAGTGVVFNLEEKPWGPNYFRVGLGLMTDFEGRGDFNIKISHNRHWLNANAAEWRNRLQIGSTPRWSSEWYQPLNWTTSLANDWFVAPHLTLERRELRVYRPLGADENGGDPVELGRYLRGLIRYGVDIGQPWGRWGELRLGIVHESLRIAPEIVSGDAEGRTTLVAERARELGVRVGVVADQLDYAIFPSRGWRVDASATVGRRRDETALDNADTGRRRYTRFELSAIGVGSLDRHTLDAALRWWSSSQSSSTGVGYYTLGGFQNLSGYQPQQLSGNDVLLGRLVYRYRLSAQPVMTRGAYVGLSLEAGNAWARRRDVALNELRSGYSVFLGADTGIGPLYLGVGYAPLGATQLFLLLGRP